MSRLVLAAVAVLVCAFRSAALACPAVDGLVDLNCDQMLKVSVTGDSIVRGRGDPDISRISGGWVADLASLHQGMSFENLGVPGISSSRLFSLFRTNARAGRKTTHKLAASDYVIIEVGTNDFWEGVTAERTVRNVQRLKLYLESLFKKTHKLTPIVAVTTLPPTRRSYQQPFVDKINRRLLLPAYKKALNVQIRFDQLVASEIISEDLVHPHRRGYELMAEVADSVLYTALQREALKRLPDVDEDGIYDVWESKYGTEAAKNDTDQDGLCDGAEVFLYKSDPLDPASPPPVQYE